MQKFIIPAMFVTIGIPLILYDAWTTSGELDALKAEDREAREAICAKGLADAPISGEEARAVCRCFVAEADRRGLTAQSIGDDMSKLRPIIASCERKHVEP